MRDDFKAAVVRELAARAGNRCSNPSCLRPTNGPDGALGVASIGVAAHVSAAAAGGPRFDHRLSPIERSDASNGIWLCQTCSRLVDTDVASHPVSVLEDWKKLAEVRAYLALRGYDVVQSRSFTALEQKIPDLVAEIRTDVLEHPFTRELVLLSKKWSYNPGRNPYFVYYFEAHEHLLGKLKMCENYGAVVPTTYNNVDRFELTEDFVEYLSLCR